MDFHTDLVVKSETPFRAEAYVPASTVQTHASNLLVLPNGDLLCAWFGGSQEGCSDISIHLSRLRKGSRTWEAPTKISDDPHRSEQNPVLFPEPDESRLWILYTAQVAGDQDKAIVRYRTSTDQGRSWGDPEQLFPEVGAFIRQPITVRPDGTWLLPIWYCRTPEGYRWNGSDDISAVRYSQDGGKTWGEKLVPNSVGCVHMNIRPLPDGSFVAFYRSRWADNVYQSTSVDGIEWTEPVPTKLPNPNSGICFEVLRNGELMIVYNDSSASSQTSRRLGLYDDIVSEEDKRVNQPTVSREAVWGTPRKALTVGISADHGFTWRTRLLEEGDGFCMTNNSKEKMNRELSYPSIALDEKEGVVHVAFTYWRQRIKYVRLKGDFVG